MAPAVRKLITLIVACMALGCATRQRNTLSDVEALEVHPEEKLGVDDVFEVRVVGEPDLSGSFRVSANGTVDYPFVGRLQIVGLTSGAVQQLITTKLKDGFLKNPQVTVMVTEWNSRKVSVFGQVAKPGAVPYFPGMTIVDAIAAAGDFTATAAKNQVKLRREVSGKVTTTTFPVSDIREGRHPNVGLRPGDFVVVEERLF